MECRYAHKNAAYDSIGLRHVAPTRAVVPRYFRPYKLYYTRRKTTTSFTKN
jgi:hypothetical protein